MDRDEGGERELEVPAAAAGMRLDQFLAGPIESRAQAQSLIEAGLVQVDGRTRPKRHRVAAGEQVRVSDVTSTPAAPVSAPPLSITHEDPYLLVVDKPAGVVVHPARGHRSGTLAQALAGRASGGEEPTRPGIVHRLDKDTSGLLVIAKSDAVHRALKLALSERRLHREYLALVEGIPPARSGTIEAPIGRARQDRKLMSIDTEQPREARTHFEIVRTFARHALLRVVLDTGRTHQIRVHLAAIGHPVCGDAAYGGSACFGLQRQFLHAGRLRFEHPVSGRAIDLESDLPPDLKRVLEAAAGEPVNASAKG